MRIGLITGEYPPLQGGVSNHVAVLAEYLTQHGHTIFIFSNSGAQQQQDTIPVMNTISKWGYQANRLIEQWATENTLDVVNLHFQTAAFDMSAWVHFMPQMVKTPFVTTFHDLRYPYLFPKAGKLRDWIVMHLAKTSDAIIVTNHEDYERIQHLPSAMIPIGSSIARASDVDTVTIRQQLGVQADDFLLAHFGFINHSKGVETLLQAIKQLNDPTLKLLMIGGRTGTADPTNKTYADQIDDLIDELNISDNILWTGFVTNDEVGQYLQAADLVTLPFRDGASFRRSSLMAAIEQGCPIITTQPIVDVPDFSNGQLHLVAPENPHALARAIQSLKTDTQQLETLKQEVKVLRKRFDWDVITQDNIDFFRHVIEVQA